MSPILMFLLGALLFFFFFHSMGDTTTVPTENKAKLYLCINSCAMCVEHWEPGLYNGPRCAKQCLKHKGQRIVDPDCVKLKMFNYEPEVLKQHRKFIREQNGDD
ncbi:uncharacterized protein LOC129976115 [Argiope bruennichi]|uniref:uncharacterized protein LOC129976115 n=1 Tax=Argiope bruennichi TaxID=94029 RepID=UPI002493DCA1|nr:uncharacterized protein LOC129976115 [Argiope bruennichi]